MPGSPPIPWTFQPPPGRARGFTLVEVLVAIVVVAVGLLGIAKLQAVGLSGSKHGRMRAMAALQADSMAASMGGLPGFWGVASLAHYRLSNGKVFDGTSSVELVPATDCSSASCTEPDMALFELRRWSDRLNTYFPGYAAAVRCDTGSPRQCTVGVTWVEGVVVAAAAAPSTSPSTSTQTFILQVLP